MDTADTEHFDSALLRQAMLDAEQRGWRHVCIVAAAREAGLPLDVARHRFPLKASLLLQLGRQADDSALRDEDLAGTPREKLFDLLMRRFDVFQQYRGGVRSVLKALPFDPALALLLGAATFDSMQWLAPAAGIDVSGLRGKLRIKAVMAIWAYALRAWERDESEDLSATMAAMDNALDRAERLGFFGAGLPGEIAPPAVNDGPQGMPEPLEA